MFMLELFDLMEKICIKNIKNIVLKKMKPQLFFFLKKPSVVLIGGTFNEVNVNEFHVNESTANESHFNESAVNESHVNESTVNESHVNV